MMNEDDDIQLPSTKVGVTDSDKMANEAVDEILMEVRRLIADIDNPFTLLGKMVAVLGRDKVVEELGDESLNEEQQGKVGALAGQVSSGMSPGMMDALALQQLQRGAAALESEARSLKSTPPPAQAAAPAPRGQRPSKEENDEEPSPPPKRPRPQQDQDREAPHPPHSSEPRPAAPANGHTAPASNASPTASQQQPKAAPPAVQVSPPPPPTSPPSPPQPVEGSLAYLPPENGLGGRYGDSGVQPVYLTQQVSATMDFMKRINSLELSNFLSNVFGKERTIEILGSYESRGWISAEVAKMLVDCVTLVERTEFEMAGRKSGELHAEDHQVALFLLDEFNKSLFNVSLSLRFREMMAAMKAASEVHFSMGVLDIAAEDGEKP